LLPVIMRLQHAARAYKTLQYFRQHLLQHLLCFILHVRTPLTPLTREHFWTVIMHGQVMTLWGCVEIRIDQ